VPRWVGEDVGARAGRAQPPRADRLDRRGSGGKVVDHHVEVDLLRHRVVWPGWRLVVGRELEAKPGRASLAATTTKSSLE
jgi:hypothetical protein